MKTTKISEGQENQKIKPCGGFKGSQGLSQRHHHKVKQAVRGRFSKQGAKNQPLPKALKNKKTEKIQLRPSLAKKPPSKRNQDPLKKYQSQVARMCRHADSISKNSKKYKYLKRRQRVLKRELDYLVQKKAIAYLNQATQKKAALLIGINYEGDPTSSLSGCINDVKTVQDMLRGKFSFDKKDICLMSDHSEQNLRPTKGNILMQIDTLVAKVKSEKISQVWFHYSGHGSYVYDFEGDEKDHRDETIIPLDYIKSGEIKDDLLFSRLVQQLPKSTQLLCVMDCCHSGTGMDLPYKFDKNRHLRSNTKTRDVAADVMMISGCKDKQTSADAYDLNQQGKWSGAMTWSLTKTLQDTNYNLNFKQLLQGMRNSLKKEGFRQIPQFTSSSKIDMTGLFFANIRGNAQIMTPLKLS